MSRRRGFGDGYERGRDDRSCHKCGQTGHLIRECPQNDRRNVPQGYNMERCTNCEGKGHHASQCPSFRDSERFNRFSSDNGSRSSSSSFARQDAGEFGAYRSKGIERDSDGYRNPHESAEDGEPRKPYMVTVATTEEEAVSRNRSGINFDRYDDIQIKVSFSDGHHTNIFDDRKLDTFQDAGLCDEIIAMLNKMKFVKPTPVQKYAIPILFEGNDLLACAQTGSGKTAAFILPIVQSIIASNLGVKCHERPQKPYALILTPTRELAVQITKDAQSYCLRTNISIKESYGGTDVSHQTQNIIKGCHVVVGTTGRTKDFLNKRVLSLENLQYLVLDEADRMLDMGFSQDVDEILNDATRRQNSRPQVVMFSATFPKEVQMMARKYLRDDYVKLDVGAVGVVNADIEQFVEQIGEFSAKKTRLIELIKAEQSLDRNAKLLVFVETKKSADNLATFLSEMDINAMSMHGDRLQQQREEALRYFQRRDCHVLVATSVCARGLDISGVSHVVNFDLPKAIEDYVHRVGRTGRVGNKGRATSFYNSSRDYHLRDGLRESLVNGGTTPPGFLADDDVPSSLGDVDPANSWR